MTTVDSDKYDKDEVDYSLGYKPAHCGICEHYLTSGHCRIVAGKIDPKYWCKKFKKNG